MILLLEPDEWTASSLAPAVSPDTQVVADVVALRRLLADGSGHELVVIGPSVEMAVVTDFTGTERVQRPTLGVVLVRRRIDTTTLKEAIRAGVREVVKADDLTGLTSACEESLALTREVRGESGVTVTPTGSLGQLVTVFSAKGGCGKTTVATNLAAALAHRGRKTCLVDLDLAFGDVAIALQLYPERGIVDLASLPRHLDRTSIAGAVTHHSKNLDTVLAPVEPGAVELISAELVVELLQVLKSMYDVVVVDTPPAFTDQVLAAFDASDHMALLTTLDVPALKNLKLALETLDLLGYSRDRFHVVLNRADAKVGLAVEHVQQTLGMPIAVQLPSSRAVPAAINRGVPIVLDSPGHAVSAAIRRLADTVTAGDHSLATHARRRPLSLRRRPQDVTA